MSFTKKAPNIRTVAINNGDTLKTIALRELGTAAGWVDLVLLNALVPPYIADTASRGVLRYGDLIRVPAPASDIAFDTDPGTIYGCDVLVSAGVLAASDGGDIELVRGVPNFSQALRHRVAVDKRELAFHPEFGCWIRDVLGDLNGPTRVYLAAWYVKSALLEDSRVSAVPSAVGEADGDTIRVTARVEPISGKPVDMELVI